MQGGRPDFLQRGGLAGSRKGFLAGITRVLAGEATHGGEQGVFFLLFFFSVSPPQCYVKNIPKNAL